MQVSDRVRQPNLLPVAGGGTLQSSRYITLSRDILECVFHERIMLLHDEVFSIWRLNSLLCHLIFLVTIDQHFELAIVHLEN